MKTIFVVFNSSSVEEANTKKLTKYAFNTEEDVKVGDIISSRSYQGTMLVTDILDSYYQYYNSKTGNLTYAINSTFCYPIKELVLSTENTEKVYFTQTSNL